MTNQESIITLRSLTHAIKAKKLLAGYGIEARVTKPNAQRTDKGCGYGIAVAQSEKERAEKLLRENEVIPLDI